MVNLWVIAAGALAGLGVFLAVREAIPGRPRLDAALARLAGARDPEPGLLSSGRIGQRMSEFAPWLPVPAADLALLGQDRAQWLTSKMFCGGLGLALIPAATLTLALAGYSLPWTVPAVGSLVVGAALFYAPDLVTRANAAEKRTDFRHALTSYVDLVSLERGAGAAPTEALEAAADIGGGWAFARISAALDSARKASRPPWDGLADLAAQTGVRELADLAEIAGVAGHEGAKILDTLAAKAASMRAEALSEARAKAGSRSTTMVVPIALLAAGFLLLLIFPIAFKIFGKL